MAIPKAPGGEMPFLDHLEELRWRIIYSLLGATVGLAVGLYVSFAYDLLGWLEKPLLPYMSAGRHLVVLHPMDGFTIHLQLAIVIGLVIAAPIIVYQIWAFLAPALHKPEKRVVIPVLFASGFLFLAGVALAWFYVLPASLKWFYGINFGTFETMYAATEYFSFASEMALAFGIAFELPLVIVALVALGIVKVSFLNRSRKWAFLLIFIAAAVISPGDQVIATCALAGPLYLLFELSIIVSFIIERSRRKARERDDEDGVAPP